jgi:hypothetical protein
MAKATRIWEAMDWYEIWIGDKESILDTMIRNMTSDLEHGYDYFGKSITEQREMIEAYRADIDKTLDMFKTMDSTAIIRWCYFDLKKRGAIA